MRDDGFHVIKPCEKGAEVLSHTPLEGEALGAPAVWNGKIYVHTTRKLYCFGSESGSKQLPARPEASTAPAAGEPKQIQVVPSEVALRPGEKQTFRLRALDANGLFVNDLSGGEWKKFVPATAKVRSEMDADFDGSGALVVKPDAKPSAGSWELTADGLKGYMRGRVLPSVPYAQDFETFQPTEQTERPPGVKFAWPPLQWIGARFKWDIRELDSVFASKTWACRRENAPLSSETDRFSAEVVGKVLKRAAKLCPNFVRSGMAEQIGAQKFGCNSCPFAVRRRVDTARSVTYL